MKALTIGCPKLWTLELKPDPARHRPSKSDVVRECQALLESINLARCYHRPDSFPLIDCRLPERTEEGLK
jgi:hypothetical protein